MANNPNITSFSGIMIEDYNGTGTCLTPPSMTTAQSNALVNTTDPLNPIKPGTLIYNIDVASAQVFQGGAWVNVGGGGGAGNVTAPANTKANAISAWSGDDSTTLKNTTVTATAGALVAPTSMSSPSVLVTNGVNTATITAGAGNSTLVLPAAAGVNGQVLSTNGNAGVLSWVNNAGGGVVGPVGSVVGNIATWGDITGDSLVSTGIPINGNLIGTAGTTSFTGQSVTLSGVLTTNQIIVSGVGGGNSTLLDSKATAPNVVFNLPPTIGAANNILLTDGAGNASWGAANTVLAPQVGIANAPVTVILAGADGKNVTIVINDQGIITNVAVAG